MTEVTICSPSSGFRWIVLLLSWLAVTLTFTDRLAWATVAVQAGESLGIPLAALGVFVTGFYVGYVLSNVVGGVSSDRFGPERTMLLSLLPLGIATACFGLTTGLMFGLVMQFAMGLFAGANHSATVKLIVSWFAIKERGRAVGILTSANSSGVFVANMVVPFLSAGLGWRSAYFVLGSVTAIFAIVVFLVLGRRRIPAAPGTTPGKRDYARLLKDRELLLLSVVGFCAMWGTWGFAFWANALMTKRFDLSMMEAGGNLALYGLAGAVSKPIIGYALDMLGHDRRKIMLIGILGAFGALLVLYGTITDPALLTMLTPILGITAFGYTPIIVAMVSDAAGTQRTGSAIGLTNGVWQIGSVIVPVAVGVVYGSTQSFALAFITLAAGPLLGCAFALTMRISDRRLSDAGSA